MKYITKFEAEQRAEQLEKRWGFGVFEDEEKKKPLMPNNVARGLVENMLMDDLNPLEDIVHKHLKNHIERYGTAKDYDSLKIFKDFERQLVLPAVRSLDEKGSSMEDSEYSEFGAGNWKSDDTSQVWSAMEMDAFVDEMYHEMINDSRSSSTRLETRNDFKNKSDGLKFKFKLKRGEKYMIGGQWVTVSGNNFGDWGENYNARWSTPQDVRDLRVGTLVMYADGRIELIAGGDVVSKGNNGLDSMSEIIDEGYRS